MSLDQLRHQTATTGRAEIARNRATCLVWTIFYGAFLLLGVGCIYGGAFGGGERGFIFAGVVISIIGVIRTAQLGPGVLGRSSVVVDGDGVRVGRRLAPWSEIATVAPSYVKSRGVKHHTVVLADAEGRTPFHAPGVRALSWPWGGQELPRALVITQPDLLIFLREQLALTRERRPTIAPPLFD